MRKLQETAENCWKLCDNYVANGDWRGGNPFFTQY